MANTHANRGKSLEDALDWIHAQYRAAGLIVERTEPPTRAGTIGARPCRFPIPGTAGILDYLVVTDSGSYRFDAAIGTALVLMKPAGGIKKPA